MTPEETTERAGLIQRSAAALHARRRWAEAEALAFRAAALLTTQPDTPHLASTCVGLAGTFDDLGHPVRAEALYRRAGAILSVLPPGGPHDLVRIRCASGLAANLRVQRRGWEADVILVAAVALAEQLLGPCDGETLSTMVGLGLVWEGLGRIDEAEDIFRQALVRAESGAGAGADEVAAIAAALSGLIERRGCLIA